jgi:dipeptidyl aminopeptidase/acylaminoacyl peptidase
MGGAPRKLIDDGRMASVSRDGSQVVFVRGPNLDEELWIMQADGEGARKLLGGQKSVFGPAAWSPDGRRIVYTQGAYEPAEYGMTAGIRMLDLASGRQESLLPSDKTFPLLHTDENGAHFGKGVVWTRDNRLIYSFSEPRPNEEDSNLWSIQLNSQGRAFGTPVRLTATPDDVGAINATQDDKRIAFTKYSQNPDVYVAEMNASATGITAPRQLTLDQRRDYPFTWTPDSRTVVFASDRDGLFHIFKQQVDESIPELLVGGNDAAMGPRLTPDGSAVLYVIWPKLGEKAREGRLMGVPLKGGPPRVVLEQRDLGNMQCARLPSTLCLFDVRDEKKMSFFRFDSATGKSEEIPSLAIDDQPSYAYNWSLSPDGKFLATAKREGVQKDPCITLFSIDDGTKRTITVQAWAGISAIDFSADGRSLLASAYTNAWKWALLKIDLQGHTTTLLEDSEMMIGWAIPAPDGKHLALWKARGSANVWMLEQK